MGGLPSVGDAASAPQVTSVTDNAGARQLRGRPPPGDAGRRAHGCIDLARSSASCGRVVKRPPAIFPATYDTPRLSLSTPTRRCLFSHTSRQSFRPNIMLKTKFSIVPSVYKCSFTLHRCCCACAGNFLWKRSRCCQLVQR